MRCGAFSNTVFEAVIAPSFAEIFYSNAMNNRLLLVQLEREVSRCADARGDRDARRIDVISTSKRQTVTSASGERVHVPLGARHKRMVIEGMDTIDLTLTPSPRSKHSNARTSRGIAWAAVM